ncbi:hypothetical protein RRG08_056703 [Elysia crispata]|uniref:IgGFc-binding protein N-terminal domain-containing protein n=1 Tax=Elysia crispata TaxID=231223 RepID=A0AAE1E5E6_9GAST|nr:hypothetical protein RRG08_056703 [Elysia crispata]
MGMLIYRSSFMITDDLLTALISLATLAIYVHSENAHPGSVGLGFAVFADPGIFKGLASTRNSDLEITLTPYDARGSYVTVECPLCSPASFPKQERQFKFGEIYSILAPVQSKPGRLGTLTASISITSSHPVSVMVNYLPNNQDRFLAQALPIERLDNKYILTNYDEKGFLAVVAVAVGQTSVYLKKPPGNSNLLCPGVQGDLWSQMPVTLHQFETWVMRCNYFTGSSVYASNVVAVFIGNIDSHAISPHGRRDPANLNQARLMEQALPLTACGRTFVVPGKLNKTLPAAFVRIVACYNNVKVTFQTEETSLLSLGSYSEKEVPPEGSYLECTVGCQVTLFYYSTSNQTQIKGGNSMVNLFPIRLFTSTVTFSIVSSKSGGDHVVLILILPQGDHEIVNMCHNATCGNEITMTPDPGWRAVNQSASMPGWRIWHKSTGSKEVHTVFQINKTYFGLYVFRPALGHGAITAAGFNLPAQDCVTTIMRVDDNVDNDCDGNVDEELQNNEDDDFDGTVDEDLRTSLQTLLHGIWSEWSGWDCWTPCGGTGRFRRYRFCDRPSPTAQGRACTGEFVEYANRICDYSDVPCLHECPFTKWGPRCNEDCSVDCLNQTCHHETGHCMGCRPGRLGELCQLECPIYRFGAGCTQSCLDFCLDHCDAETGECDSGTSIVRLLLACIAVGVTPGVLVWAGISICLRQDPDRRALIRTIRSLDQRVTDVKLLIKASDMNRREIRRRLKKQKKTEDVPEKIKARPEQRLSGSKYPWLRPHTILLDAVSSKASSVMELVRGSKQPSMTSVD